MSKNPFDFDMRASTTRKPSRGRRAMSGAVETSSRPCAHPGCERGGQYRAPRSPDAVDDYLWFCVDHVREYNLKWNFFAGQTEAETRQTMEQDRVWGRATQAMGGSAAREAAGWARHGIDDPHQLLGEKATRRAPAANEVRPGGNPTRRLPSTERRAIEILDVRDTWSRSEIRKQYKGLVKDLHPDTNGGDRTVEERLQEVVWAWDQIKDSRNFRD